MKDSAFNDVKKVGKPSPNGNLSGSFSPVAPSFSPSETKGFFLLLLRRRCFFCLLPRQSRAGPEKMRHLRRNVKEKGEVNSPLNVNRIGMIEQYFPFLFRHPNRRGHFALTRTLAAA